MGLFNKLFGNGISAPMETHIENQLKTVLEPMTKQDLMSLNALQSAELKKNTLRLNLELPYPCQSLWPAITQQIQHSLQSLEEVKTVECHYQTKVVVHDVQKGTNPMANVKNIIAIASGKGGVGKSTTTVNLALALQQEGARVGILDADIYGPSMPTMLGIKDKPQTVDGKSMQPLHAYGLQVMSIGALIEPDSPMIWRGPIVTQTLQQLLNETNWDNLDYLLIDLPPGTGDVQLTLAQSIPVTGSVIVTTPQEVSLIDARKGLKMFEKVEIPILGIVENMSTHICSNCGHEEAIFGADGGKRMAEEYKVKFLGALPLEKRIREEADQGMPTVTAEPTSELANKYRAIAHQISADIAVKKRNYANLFPKIEIVNS